jgi:hypothetical protein
VEPGREMSNFFEESGFETFRSHPDQERLSETKSPAEAGLLGFVEPADKKSNSLIGLFRQIYGLSRFLKDNKL